MRRILPLVFLLVLAAPMPVRAAAPYLAWDECRPAGLSWKAFACNTNVGSSVLVGSFTAPAGIAQFVGVETEIFLDFQGVTPPWWQLRNQAGQINQCRNGSLTADAAFAANGLSACTDPFFGSGVGGIASYQVGPGGNPNQARLVTVFSIPATVALVEDQHYYSSRIRIDHARSTGTGSCAGCSNPAVALVRSITLYQPSSPDVVLRIPTANGQSTAMPEQIAGWQCPGSGGVSCTSFGLCSVFLTAACATPVLRSTWSGVKTLYR